MTDKNGRQMTYEEVAAEMVLAHEKTERVAAEERTAVEEWAPFGPCPSNE